MTPDVIPREQCYRHARAVLDAARARIAADYAAGRLDSQRAAQFEELHARAPYRAAA